MATRAYTLTEVEGGGYIVAWTGLANGDDGAPLVGAAAADRSIHFTGTFGTGGTIVFEGGNLAGSYVTLTDPQGNDISKTAAGLEVVMEAARHVRPRVTAGDGTTSLNAYLFIKR